MPPVACNGAQRAAGEFGQRVVRDGFAAVEEERDFIAAENPRQRFVVIVEVADENGAIAESVADADEFQNLARGERGFGFGIGAGGEADGIHRRVGLRPDAPGWRPALRRVDWQCPAFFERGQRGIFCKAALFRLAFENFNFDFATRQIFNPLAAPLKGFAEG